MPDIKIDPRLIALLVDEAPAVIGYVQQLFAKKHPDQPLPTSEEVRAAYEQMFVKSLATDDAILGSQS